MLLYRGQPTAAAIADAASRRSPWLADAMAARLGEPAGRAQGRWFTDDIAIARWYVEDASAVPGTAEVVAIEVPDALAETFRVSRTPETDCGLSPGRFSRDPEREFLLPREIADRAVPLESSGVGVDRSHSIRDNSLFGGKIMADAPTITYEGDDTSEHDERFRRLYAMPGERLRVDPKARVEGVAGSTLGETIGTEPLTVSRTVMTGEQPYVRPEYEFEGVEGRFSAGLFQHEKGEQNMHAVLEMRDSEMWAVPIEIKFGNEAEGTKDVVTLQGPAREITGFTGRSTDQIHPEGLEGMRSEVANGSFTADLYVRNATTFEDSTGPVEVVAMPMSYGAPSELESAVAGPAIDAAAFEKRVGEVVRDSEALLRTGGLEHENGGERSEITDLVGALDARRREPTMQNSGHVLDAANATLGMMDDTGQSGRPGWDKLAYSVEAAERAGDTLLKNRYADLGLTAASARDMESLAKQHDDAVEAGTSKPNAPSPAIKGAVLASQAARSM